MTPDLTHDIVDINVAQINFHYYDLFYAYTNLRERGVQAADEPDVNRFRLIQQATVLIADKNNLGQTWGQVLAEYPGIERVREGREKYIVQSSIGSGSTDNGGSTQTRSTQSEWLIDNSYLPIEYFGVRFLSTFGESG